MERTLVSVDAGSFEEQVHPGPGGAPVEGFQNALGLELFHDPHFVVDVGSKRVRLGDGAFGEHDHAVRPPSTTRVVPVM